jgi:hypothetical protein
MAAERAWDAAHGKEMHYMVGKEAERARFAARFFPNAMRNQPARRHSWTMTKTTNAAFGARRFVQTRTADLA